ncbi:hypothetical protein [Legionella londiniensis]|uniref:Uncharacterized protein n=1 Tax=Legionella londiniensis TaxID=45068 RepID=A0A0W0VQK3_9GAMM|nr:hypothetical protein [Legionella londiniensis]KTD22496.1 hypothetical protein Llon_0536 [Legionella londiniensis]STX93351.1 Uncharacterised protein [Legionella londiniensis]
MWTISDIQRIIHVCRCAGKKGLGNGNKGIIPPLEIDILTPPHDFLGIGENPAIFVNEHTFSLLGKHHNQWKENQTIAVKKDFLTLQTMQMIGILVHETGHAFNVAADIPNTEANAYIFEIEILSNWHQNKYTFYTDFSTDDLQKYFSSRLPYYRKETKNSSYLQELVKRIEEEGQKNLQIASTSTLILQKNKRSYHKLCFFNESLLTKEIEEFHKMYYSATLHDECQIL